MEIQIDKVVIKNFRSLKEITLNLKDYCLLVGKNNCGKSNIIQALTYAFSYSSIEKEDIFVSPSEPFSFDTKITIDIRIIPIDTNGNRKKEFDDEWTVAFGVNKAIDFITDEEFFAFRTEIIYNKDRERYINKKKCIENWTEDDIKIGNIIKRDTFDSIENIFINAQRDISLDIRDKKSAWGKLTSNINITDSDKNHLNSQIETLNHEIVENADILQSITNELQNTTADTESKIYISPLTKNIETIYSTMNIFYETKNSMPTAVENLGLGIRSWAVFSTIKAQIISMIKKANSEFAYFPILLIEEPEVHVHPQAQRQLFSDINEIDGQKIITTHSPYILSQIDLDKIIYVKKEEEFTITEPLLLSGLADEDIRKIKRTVMNTRGEILYANAVILAEGETEEQAFSIYLREYFDKEPFELGINIIGVGGNNYLPFIRLLRILGIKWYIFSDGEEQALIDLKKCISSLNDDDCDINLDNYNNIFYLNDGHCFETYLIEKNYQKEIIRAICKIEKNENYMDYFIKTYAHQKGKKGIPRDYHSEGGIIRALRDCMLMNKTKYATFIAKEICCTESKERRIPEKIKDLFNKIKFDLDI